MGCAFQKGQLRKGCFPVDAKENPADSRKAAEHAYSVGGEEEKADYCILWKKEIEVWKKFLPKK